MAELIQPKVFSDIEDAMNSGAINTIKVNNVAQSITDKTVNLSVPSNAGDVGAYTKAETNGLLSNPNLLDNPFFTINQREKWGAIDSSTSVAYGFDRWFGSYNAVQSTKRIYFSEQGKYCIQSLEPELFNSLIGKILTASVLFADGTLTSGSLTLADTSTGRYFFASDRVHVLINENNRFQIWANVMCNIVAVKLELGSVSTLANDVAPNPEDELIRCRTSHADPADTYANDKVQLASDNVKTVAGGKNLFNPKLLTNNIKELGADYFIVEASYNHGHSVYDLTPFKGQTIYISALGQVYEGGNPHVQIIIDSTYYELNTNPRDYSIVVPSNATYAKIRFYARNGAISTKQSSKYSNVIISNEPTNGYYEPYYESNLVLTRKQNIVNLLNCTLGTNSYSGTLTVTNNGDGTYTFNGAPTSNTWVTLTPTRQSLKGGTYKVLGVRNLSDVSACYAQFYNSAGTNISNDVNSGKVFSSTDIASVSFTVACYPGKTLSSVIVKPMITECFDAEYDDFVEYGHYLPSIMQTSDDLSIQGLTFNKCSYIKGGYLRIGNLILVEMRLSLEANIPAWTVIVSGLPTTGGQEIPCSVWSSAIQLDATNGTIRTSATTPNNVATINFAVIYITR